MLLEWSSCYEARSGPPASHGFYAGGRGNSLCRTQGLYSYNSSVITKNLLLFFFPFFTQYPFPFDKGPDNNIINSLGVFRGQNLQTFFQLSGPFLRYLKCKSEEKFFRGGGLVIGVKWPKKALECTICDPRIQKIPGGARGRAPRPLYNNLPIWVPLTIRVHPPSSLVFRTFQTFLPKPILTPVYCTCTQHLYHLLYFNNMFLNMIFSGPAAGYRIFIPHEPWLSAASRQRLSYICSTKGMKKVHVSWHGTATNSNR